MDNTLLTTLKVLFIENGIAFDKLTSCSTGTGLYYRVNIELKAGTPASKVFFLLPALKTAVGAPCRITVEGDRLYIESPRHDAKLDASALHPDARGRLSLGVAPNGRAVHAHGSLLVAGDSGKSTLLKTIMSCGTQETAKSLHMCAREQDVEANSITRGEEIAEALTSLVDETKKRLHNKNMDPSINVFIDDLDVIAGGEADPNKEMLADIIYLAKFGYRVGIRLVASVSRWNQIAYILGLNFRQVLSTRQSRANRRSNLFISEEVYDLQTEPREALLFDKLMHKQFLIIPEYHELNFTEKHENQSSAKQ